MILGLEKPLAGGWAYQPESDLACGGEGADRCPPTPPLQPPFPSPPRPPHLFNPPAEGLKLNLAYDVAKRNPSAVVTLNRTVRGAAAQLRATYRRVGDVLILDQQWKLDKATTLAGSYNFASEEAAVSLTRTHGPWTAHGAYNFAKDAVLLDVKRKSGADTVGVTYQPREDAATLHWSRKPIRVGGVLFFYRGSWVLAAIAIAAGRAEGLRSECPGFPGGPTSIRVES